MSGALSPSRSAGGQTPSGPHSLTRLAAVLLAAVDVVASVGVLVYSHTVGTGSGTGGFLGDLASVIVVVSFAAVGGVVAFQLPTNVVAWLLLAVATTGAGLWWLPGGWVPPIGILGMHLLLYFPDSRLPSPRWRWFAWAAAVLIVILTFVGSTADAVLPTGGANPFYVPWAITLGPALVLFPAFILISAASLRIRFRRAGAVEREQIRWIAWSGAFIAVLYTITLVLSTLFESPGTSSWGQSPAGDVLLPALQLVALLSFVLLPVTIGVAVLRYRLFDIERLVSRSTSYVLVTGISVSVYAVAVTFASRLLPVSSTFAVAAATLAAAAAFRPALTRVQRTVDRRFDRRRFDAALLVDQFGAHLRDVVEADDIVRSLTAAVTTSLQPASVVLWLREQPAPGR